MNPEQKNAFTKRWAVKYGTLQAEMFKLHSHAEIEHDKNPSAVVYTEKSVQALLRLQRQLLTGKVDTSADIDAIVAQVLYNQVDARRILKEKYSIVPLTNLNTNF